MDFNHQSFVMAMNNSSSSEPKVYKDHSSTVVENYLDTAIGVVYVTFAVSILLGYVPCMLAILRDKELRSMLSYKIILHLGVSDLLQTVFHAVGGLMVILKTTGPYVVNMIFGGIMNSSWMSYSALLHLLAFNRFVHFCLIWLGLAWLHAVVWLILYFTPIVDFVFLMEDYAWFYSGPYGPTFVDVEFYQTCLHFGLTGMEYIAIWISLGLMIWLGLAWLHAVVWLILYFTPIVDFVFLMEDYAWFYSGPNGPTFVDVEFYQTCLHFGLTGMEYIAIWISLRLMRKNISQQNAGNAEKNEKRIMVQGGLLFTYPTIMLVYWHLGPKFLPASWGKWVGITCNLFWMSNGAVNPIIYLTMNKTLRRRVKALLGLKNTVSAETGARATTRAGRSTKTTKKPNTVKTVSVTPIGMETRKKAWEVQPVPSSQSPGESGGH